MALVERSAGATATPDEIVRHASERIARCKLPKHVLFLDTIQRSPSGKADYRWARSRAQ